MTIRTLYFIVIAILVLVGAAVAYAVCPPALDPVAPPAPNSFDAKAVERGRQLALIGNCNECHTAQGGQPYAGGRPVKTPFGTIYATNITPDPETGIGAWSEQAFRRAMRRGLDRDGDHLYPAFPYTHFTKLADEDIDAIYAFLMTREPVRNTAPENELPFPLNMRPVIAGWKLLFFDEGRFQPNPSLNDQLNRGAYLVEAMAHCGACHTPRNFLQAEMRDQFLRGSQTEGWHAPAIAGIAPAAIPWTEESLSAYLRGRFSEHHGVAVGPMGSVAENLARVQEEEVHAISAYVASLTASDEARQAQADQLLAIAQQDPEGVETPAVTGAVVGEPLEGGAAIYAGACAHCHEGGTPSRFAEGLELSLSTSIRASDPRNLIHIIREGVHPPEGEPGFFMPGFDAALTEEQIVNLAAYLRDTFTNLPPWADLQTVVSDVVQDENSPGGEKSQTAQNAEGQS